MKRIFSIIGQLALRLITGAAGGIGLLMAMSYLPTICSDLGTSLKQPQVSQLPHSDVGTALQSCLSEQDYRKLASLAFVLTGGENPNQDTAPVVCLSLSQGLERSCAAVKGGWSGQDACKSLSGQ